MSAQPIVPTDIDALVEQSSCFVLSGGSYERTPTAVLADSLEAQHDGGEPLCPEMVFEVLGRLLEVEGLCVPVKEE